MRITPTIVKKAFPERDPQTQKWDYGHCLIIAGSRDFFGAALLAIGAALKSGSGLVTLATVNSMRPFLYSRFSGALSLGLEETQEGSIKQEALRTVLSYVQDRRVTSVVLGPGLTRNPSTAHFVREFVDQVTVPLVLDADALSVKPSLKKNIFCCLTPHEREFARFVGATVERVKTNGIRLAQELVKSHSNLVVILKGPQTKIVTANGLWMNTTGNAGLAKGGSGDVLSGLLGGFLAQKKDFKGYIEASLSAVYLHGLAGDLAAKKLTQQAISAEDIASFLPKAFKKVGIR